MQEFLPEGYWGNFEKTKSNLLCVDTLYEAYENNDILEARAIICDKSHNLIVDLGKLKGIIPRNEGAIGIEEGYVRDIALISRVNKMVSFIVVGFQKDKNKKEIAVLSRRLAQEKCHKEYISKLKNGDVIPAKITHIENFGAFADIGCGIISLIPIDLISVSRIEHPSERFSINMNIKAVVKNNDNGKILLTHKELLGTWLENSENFSIGETVSGIVRSVEDYGVFIELAPNFTGLSEYKAGIRNKQVVSVYIKNMIPEKMKVKLVIINTFDEKPTLFSPKYFFTRKHMDVFQYSPKECKKQIITDFR